MKMNNRFIYGILSIVLAAIIAFVAIPAVASKTNSTREIVRMKNTVTRGTEITADDIELVEVGGFNLPLTVAQKLEDVSGTYATVDLYAGDYILPEKVSSTPISSDLSLNEIPDGKVAISISTQTLATDIDYTTPPEEDEERQQTATVTVLATPEQAMLLTRYENEGMLHVALISRGNTELANELLARQDELLESIYSDISETEELLPDVETAADSELSIDADEANEEMETSAETKNE